MQYKVNGRIYYCIIFMLLFNFHELLLNTNKVLYLQKWLLVGALQEQLLLILTNIFSVL